MCHWAVLHGLLFIQRGKMCIHGLHTAVRDSLRRAQPTNSARHSPAPAGARKDLQAQATPLLPVSGQVLNQAPALCNMLLRHLLPALLIAQHHPINAWCLKRRKAHSPMWQPRSRQAHLLNRHMSPCGTTRPRQARSLIRHAQ